MPDYLWAILLVAAIVVVVLLVRSGRAHRASGGAAGRVGGGGGPRMAAAPPPRTPASAARSYEGLIRSERLRSALADAGWARPPAVHGQALPALAQGGAVVLVAPAGPERTAAYLVAALDRSSGSDRLEALVLCTDRRHAARVAEQARSLAEADDLWVGEIHEGGDEENQLRDLRAGFDVVVATPGRLNRHLRNGEPDLRDVRLVVVEDAARIAARDDLARRLDRVLDVVPSEAQLVLVASSASSALRDRAASLAPSARWVEVDETEAAPAAAEAADDGSASPAPPPGERASPAGERVSGVVKWFNDSKGYGFLLPDGGEDDVFVHYSAIVGDGFRSLDEGGRVRFSIVDTQKGPEATDVEPI